MHTSKHYQTLIQFHGKGYTTDLYILSPIIQLNKAIHFFFQLMRTVTFSAVNVNLKYYTP